MTKDSKNQQSEESVSLNEAMTDQVFNNLKQTVSNVDDESRDNISDLIKRIMGEFGHKHFKDQANQDVVVKHFVKEIKSTRSIFSRLLNVLKITKFRISNEMIEKIGSDLINQYKEAKKDYIVSKVSEAAEGAELNQARETSATISESR